MRSTDSTKNSSKKKLASGPNQHTRPHHSTHMSIPEMVIPTNKLRYTKIQRNLIFTHWEQMTFNCQRHHFLKSTWAKIENDDTPKTEVGPPKKRPTKKNQSPYSLGPWKIKKATNKSNHYNRILGVCWHNHNKQNTIFTTEKQRQIFEMCYTNHKNIFFLWKDKDKNMVCASTNHKIKITDNSGTKLFS